MITIEQIRGGHSYHRVHLSANDYYSEGEKVTGRWHGETAARLGIEGLDVTEEYFQALRMNKHPLTGEKLTPRSRVVAFHDIVCSAPKSYSVMAMVGGDQRLVEAFHEASEVTFRELEKHAAVRLRKGVNVNTEKWKATGNAVCAIYQHDTSRLLDPQLHAHMVFANVTYDEERKGYYALQPRPIMEASKESVRAFFYYELANRAEELGYTVEWNEQGFRLAEVPLRTERKFSQRAVQRERFEQHYCQLFGRKPTKARIEQFIKERKGEATRRFRDEFKTAFKRHPNAREIKSFVRDWRSSKLERSTPDKVARLQRNKLSTGEKHHFRKVLQKVGYELSSEHINEQQRENHQQQAVSQKHDEGGTHSTATGHRWLASIREKGGELTQSLAKAHKQRQQRVKRRKNLQAYRKRIARMEAMRRFKRGLELSAALRGFPGAAVARQLRAVTRGQGYH